MSANKAFERNLESSGFQPPLPKSAQLVRHMPLKLIITALSLLLLGCRSAPRNPQIIKADIGKVVTSIRSKYSSNKQFAYYWSKDKHLRQHWVPTKHIFYGITDQIAIDEIENMFRDEMRSSSSSCHCYLCFYEKEVFHENGDARIRGKEKLLYKVKVHGGI